MLGKIDRIDLKMLRLLQGNGRLTNAELAQLVDVSPATCHRRTQALFKEGYISLTEKCLRMPNFMGPPVRKTHEAKLLLSSLGARVRRSE